MRLSLLALFRRNGSLLTRAIRRFVRLIRTIEEAVAVPVQTDAFAVFAAIFGLLARRGSVAYRRNGRQEI